MRPQRTYALPLRRRTVSTETVVTHWVGADHGRKDHAMRCRTGRPGQAEMPLADTGFGQGPLDGDSAGNTAEGDVARRADCRQRRTGIVPVGVVDRRLRHASRVGVHLSTPSCRPSGMSIRRFGGTVHGPGATGPISAAFGVSGRRTVSFKELLR